MTLYLGTKALHSKSSFVRCLKRSGVSARPRTRLGPLRIEAAPRDILTHTYRARSVYRSFVDSAVGTARIHYSK